MYVAVVVLIRAQGLARTGERYQLTCTVTKNDRSVPSINWMDLGGLITSDSSGMTLGPLMSNGTTSSSVLMFDPLAVQHGGNYTCQATFRSMTFSYTYSVVVATSEWHNYY